MQNKQSKTQTNPQHKHSGPSKEKMHKKIKPKTTINCKH